MNAYDIDIEFTRKIRDYLESIQANNLEDIYIESKKIFDSTILNQTPLVKIEQELKNKIEKYDSKKSDKIVFKISRTIYKMAKDFRIAVQNNPTYPESSTFSDWIPVLGFFAISIYLLRKPYNNLNINNKTTVVGVRG